MAGIKSQTLVYAAGGKVTATLLSLNVVVFVALHLCVWCGVDARDAVYAVTLPTTVGEILSRPWTLLSYMFVHWDVLHLLVNMLWLVCFGRILARTGLTRQVLPIYICGGFGGAIAFVTTATLHGGFGILAGASAAVMGIICAAAVLRPRTRLSLMLFGEVNLYVIAIAVIALYIIAEITSLPTCIAHAGGAAGGAAFALVYKALRHRAPRSRTDDNDDTDIEAQLDEILDKVRRGGYGSLSSYERRRLFELSKKLK